MKRLSQLSPSQRMIMRHLRERVESVRVSDNKVRIYGNLICAPQSTIDGLIKLRLIETREDGALQILVLNEVEQ
ncbi:MAG: hypothetical protein L3J65_11940 [Robiginitomaculum sp.]|nr:hypothetical protein [Robiginitomaculum sp.]